MILSTKALLLLGALVASLLAVTGTVLVKRSAQQIIVVKIPAPVPPASTVAEPWNDEQRGLIRQNLGFAPSANKKAKGYIIP